MLPLALMKQPQPIRFVFGAAGVSLIMFTGCGADDSPGAPQNPTTVVWDFAVADPGVTALFADYAPVTDVEATSGRRALPAELGTEQGYMLSGVNRSDDLWMSMSAPVAGLSSTTAYTLTATITLATDAPAGCAGVGGAPDSVFLKVGAIGRVPGRSLVEEHFRVNYDKGAQADGGSEVSRVPNDIGNGRRCRAEPRFESLVRTHTHPNPVRPNDDGTLWLIVGTDSGFESRTTLYYQKVEVVLRPNGR